MPEHAANRDMPMEEGDQRPNKIRRLINKIKDETGLTRESERLFHAGLVPLLRRGADPALEKQMLTCHPATLFCGIDMGDLGWGCGYRNIQMLLSALYAREREAAPELAMKPIPSILQLQSAVETAWQAGFDVEGAGQLRHKLYRTRKWIGTTEVYALMSFWGYDVELVQFEGAQAGKRVLQYCIMYFADQVSPLPLYFQHSGHSRTIVGVHQQQSEVALLVFDPGRALKDMVKDEEAGKLADKQVLKPFTVKAGALKLHAYQILRVGGRLTEAERNIRKIIQATLL